MKPAKLAGLLGAIVGATLLLAACGGSDSDSGDSTTNIRTDKGLAVAAIGAGFDPRLNGATDQEGAQDSAERSGVPGFANSGTVATDQRLSPYYAPTFQEGGNGITVQGYGTASADADSAIVELYFFANGGDGVEPQPVPEPGTSSSGSAGIAVGEPAPPEGDFGDSLQTVDPITEADLQAVIDSLVAAGIPRGEIEFIGQGYYDKFSSSATLRVTVDNLDVLDGAVQAASNAAANLAPIQLSNSNVTYTVADCTALESAAMTAAAEDAKDRGVAFAQTLGVGIGAITGASHYSYSPYGGSACGSSYGGPYPLAVDSVAAGGSRTVQVFANISVTYAIQ